MSKNVKVNIREIRNNKTIRFQRFDRLQVEDRNIYETEQKKELLSILCTSRE